MIILEVRFHAVIMNNGNGRSTYQAEHACQTDKMQGGVGVRRTTDSRSIADLAGIALRAGRARRYCKLIEVSQDT